MGTRGRMSAAAHSIVAGNFGERPDPAEELTEEQAAIWKETVASEAADFFKTAAQRSILKDYCRHTATARLLSDQVNVFDPAWLADEEGIKRYHLLLKMRDLETRAAVSMATKLRLTSQSRYTPHGAQSAANHAPPVVKPWKL